MPRYTIYLEVEVQAEDEHEAMKIGQNIVDFSSEPIDFVEGISVEEMEE